MPKSFGSEGSLSPDQMTDENAVNVERSIAFDELEPLEGLTDVEAVHMILEQCGIPLYGLSDVIDVEYRVIEDLELVRGEIELLDKHRPGYRTWDGPPR